MKFLAIFIGQWLKFLPFCKNRFNTVFCASRCYFLLLHVTTCYFRQHNLRVGSALADL